MPDLAYPRASLSGALTSSPAFFAGLPVSIAIVLTGHPLFANHDGFNNGSVEL